MNLLRRLFPDLNRQMQWNRSYLTLSRPHYRLGLELHQKIRETQGHRPVIARLCRRRLRRSLQQPGR